MRATDLDDTEVVVTHPMVATVASTAEPAPTNAAATTPASMTLPLTCALHARHAGRKVM
jgi:hypothetical protein